VRENDIRRTKLMLVRVAVLLAILGGLLVPLCSGCAALGVEESGPLNTENYTVSDNTLVTILGGHVDGDIRVETWGKNYVELTWTERTTWGKAELGKADVEATQVAGKLSIETDVSQNGKVTVDCELRLPRNVLLDKVTARDGSVSIEGTSGDTIVTAKFGSVSVKNAAGHLDIAAEKGKIRLEGTTGGARLSTTESAIEVINADGDVQAKTSNGGITISGCKGDMTLETSGGGIYVSDLDGCVRLARTTNGAVEISDVTAVEVAETADANVKAEFSTVGDNGTVITVKRGSISLYLASDLNADLEVKTQSGEVSANSSGGSIRLTGEFSPDYFKGTVGTGGNKIYAETSKGRIDVYGS
jgi:DUF4097 and DUF4098 domain-containing protein YvlB